MGFDSRYDLASGGQAEKLINEHKFKPLFLRGYKRMRAIKKTGSRFSNKPFLHGRRYANGRDDYHGMGHGRGICGAFQ
jgi:hypothetical protein